VVTHDPPPSPHDPSGLEFPPAESWLVRFRPWLTLLARTQVDHGYQGKFDASDLVQQTLIEAWKSAEQFRGQTEAERMAWLRQILAHVLAHEVRRYFGTLKRNADREVSFEESLEQSSRRWQGFCDSAMSSPSQHVMRQEQNVQLAEALEQLPDDYREVIVLRHLEGLSHEEVAVRMGRTPGATRMLWMRALAELKRLCAGGSSALSGRSS
jgi:RNA polymerase sigma-70 factor (ECF subfamily)